MPKNVDIQDGDILVTSGMGGHFPEGYPVAKVVRVANEEQSPFAEIKAEPLATLDRLRYVLLLWEDAKAMGPLAVMSPSSVNANASAAVSTDAEKNKNTVPERYPTTAPATKPVEKVEKKTGTTTHKSGVNKTAHQNTNKIKTSATIASTKVKHQERSQ